MLRNKQSKKPNKKCSNFHTPSLSTLTLQVVEKEQGLATAQEYKIKFFETSAKANINVNEAFNSIALDIKKRLMDNPSNQASGSSAAAPSVQLKDVGKGDKEKSKCC